MSTYSSVAFAHDEVQRARRSPCSRMLRLTNVGARPHPARHTIGDRRATRPKNYAKSHRRSHDAVIRVYDAAGNVIETHEHNGESSMCTRFGSSQTTSGERDAPRWL